MPQTWGGRRPERVVSSLARQRPQQAAGGGEEVDGGGAVGDEGRLQPESLKHLHLPDRSQPIRGVQSLQREAHVLIGCCQVTWSTQDDQGPKSNRSSYLRLWPRPRHLLQRVATQTLDQLSEALALDLGQTLLLLHLQIVHLLLVGQLLLSSLRQAL